MKNRFRFFDLVVMTIMLSPQSVTQWIQTNGPCGGTVYSLVAAEQNLFAGTYGGGIFRSTDQGMNWISTSLGLRDPYVRTLTYSGSNLFAGTIGDAAGSVFVSTDEGMSWTEADSGLNNPNIEVLASEGSRIFAGTNGGGIYRSTNNGSNWVPVNNGLPTLWNNAIYAFAFAGGNTFAGTSAGMFRSTDFGENWWALSNGLPNLAIVPLTISYYGATTLFAGTYGGGIFRSADSGATWTDITNGLTNKYVTSLSVCDSILYAGTDAGVFRSTNGGTSWSSPGVVAWDVGIWSITASEGRLFAGASGWENGGVYSSTDGGLSWNAAMAGLVGTFSIALAVAPDSSDNLFAGIQGRGVSLSSDNGNHWASINKGLAATYVNALAFSGTTLFAGTIEGVFTLAAGSCTWAPAGLTTEDVRCFAASPRGTPERGVYAGGDGVFHSSDSGATWTLASNGLPKYRVFPWDTSRYIRIHSLAFRGENIFAGTSGRGVYISTNDGLSWNPANAGLTDGTILSLFSSGADILAGTFEGIFLSTNDGSSWEPVGPAGVVVESFATSGHNIFAGSSDGVLLSTDNGLSWSAVNSGLPGITVWALASTVANLFAGTGGGVWRRPLPEMIAGFEVRSEQLPGQATLFQNYPNPFNPSTSISFVVPAQSGVSLKIFDALGREVSTLVSEILPAGRYTRRWNASHFSSGVYYYQIRVGSFSESKKLLLAK